MPNVSNIQYNGTTYGIEGVTDTTLTISGRAADAKAVGDAIMAIRSASGFTEEIKQTLLACFQQVAWIGDDGQDYYDALEAALYPQYDVTYNLTNVISSNNSTSAGSSYSTVLTATIGYINQGTVTMGGVDITNTAFTPAE